jgi:hypothetical protein
MSHGSTKGTAQQSQEHVDKKPRLMHGADGFTTGPKTARVHHLTPSFVSAFESPRDNGVPGTLFPTSKAAQSNVNGGFVAHEAFKNSFDCVKAEVIMPRKDFKPLTALHITPPQGPGTSKPVQPTRQLPAPPRSHQFSKKSKPTLKPLQPPNRLPPSTSEKATCTIKTTRVARSTDVIHTLLPFDTADVVPNELTRGILRSPEKDKGRRKGRYVRCVAFIRFLLHVVTNASRNGLAEHALQFISRSHASLNLWQSETAFIAENAPTQLNPDLRLAIISFTHLPSSSRHDHSLAFARTKVISTRNPSALGESPSRSLLVLLSFSVSPFTSEGLADGRELFVWQPWTWIGLKEAEDTTSSYHSASGIVEDRAILCTRFLFIRS